LPPELVPQNDTTNLLDLVDLGLGAFKLSADGLGRAVLRKYIMATTDEFL